MMRSLLSSFSRKPGAWTNDYANTRRKRARALLNDLSNGKTNMTTPDLKQAALDAICVEAEKLLQSSLPPDVQEAVQLINSIARYGFDVRPVG